MYICVSLYLFVHLFLSLSASLLSHSLLFLFLSVSSFVLQLRLLLARFRGTFIALASSWDTLPQTYCSKVHHVQCKLASALNTRCCLLFFLELEAGCAEFFRVPSGTPSAANCLGCIYVMSLLRTWKQRQASITAHSNTRACVHAAFGRRVAAAIRRTTLDSDHVRSFGKPSKTFTAAGA